MNCNYIRSQHPETIKKLKQLGFVVLSEENGIVTFLNDPATIKRFSQEEGLVVTYTNKLEYGG
jgi:hypothetical protein